jgi:hypothetical protein
MPLPIELSLTKFKYQGVLNIGDKMRKVFVLVALLAFVAFLGSASAVDAQSITALSASNILEGEDATVEVSLALSDLTNVTLTFYNAVTGIQMGSPQVLQNVSYSEALIYGPFDLEGSYKVVAEIPDDCRICKTNQTFAVTKPSQSLTTIIPETSLLFVVAVGILVVLFISSRKR